MTVIVIIFVCASPWWGKLLGIVIAGLMLFWALLLVLVVGLVFLMNTLGMSQDFADLCFELGVSPIAGHFALAGLILLSYYKSKNK